MPQTYDKIATQTLGSATNSHTFTSISGTYTDLVLVVAGTSASPTDCVLRFNSDTGNNYSWTRILGNGTAASSARNSNTSGQVGTLYTTQGNIIMSIQNYSNATTYKTSLSRMNSPDNHVASYVTMWRNTNAITSIEFYATGANMSVGTTLTLYGIKAA